MTSDNYTPKPVPASTTAPVPMLALPENPRVLIVGDSFAQGFGAEPQSAGYAYLLGGYLGWSDVTVDHEGRTGYTRDNEGLGANYGTRIAHRIASGDVAPDLVILQGTINDNNATTEEMTVAIQSVVDTIRAGWPNASVRSPGGISPPRRRPSTRSVAGPNWSS